MTGLRALLLVFALTAGCLGLPASDRASGPDPGPPTAEPSTSQAPVAGTEQGSPSPPSGPADPSQEAAPGNRGPPPAIHRESRYTVGLDPDSASGRPCAGPALNNCDQPTFHLDGTFDLEATLAWTTPGTDLDLYLYRGDTQVSADGRNDGPDLATSQVLHHDALPPGDYSVWVTVRHGVLGNYTLDLVFS